jgi:hypothetical protein
LAGDHFSQNRPSKQCKNDDENKASSPPCIHIEYIENIMDTKDRISVTMELLKLSKVQSKSEKEETSCALSVNKARKQGIKKAPERKPSESTVSTAHATTLEDNTGDTTGTRTPQQETSILRALGLTEGPKYPVTGEIYRIDFLEFRQHLCNKLPLYDGRAVTTLGSFRKPRNYKLVCALHPTCPFLLHGKQQIYADGLAYQDIQEVVNHTCSVQSHAHISLCSLNFLGYLLREQEQHLKGVDWCTQAGKTFGIDFTSMARQQMFYKAAKARNEQNGASALLAFRSPSPICVTPRPMYKLDPSTKMISSQLPGLSTERQSYSTTAELAAPVSAESTSYVSSVVALVPTSTGCAAENPHLRQSELKSDQLMFREAKRKLEHESVMDDNNVVFIFQDNEQGFDQERKVLQLGSKRKRETNVIRDPSRKEEVQTRKAGEEREEVKGEEQNTTVCVEENPQPGQSERKSESDQLMCREAKRKLEHEGVMDGTNVARKKRKEVPDGHSDTADTVSAASPNDWVVFASSISLNWTTCAPPKSNLASPQSTSMFTFTSTATPVSSQRSQSAPRKFKQPEYMRLLESSTPAVDERSARATQAQPNCKPAPQSTSAPNSNQQSPRKSKPEYTSVLSRADYSFPPRKTRASTSKLQNSSEKRQPDENNQNQQSKIDALNQQPNRKLKPAHAILADGLMPAMDDLPPRRSAVSGTATATTEPWTCSTGSSMSTSTAVTKQHFGTTKAKSDRLTKDLLLAKIPHPPSHSMTGSSTRTSTSVTNQQISTTEAKSDGLTKIHVLATKRPSPPSPPRIRSADLNTLDCEESADPTSLLFLASVVMDNSAGVPPPRTTSQTFASTTTSSKSLPRTITRSEQKQRPPENNGNLNQDISKCGDLNQQPNHKRRPAGVMLVEQGLVPMMLVVASYLVLVLWYNHHENS